MKTKEEEKAIKGERNEKQDNEAPLYDIDDVDGSTDNFAPI